MNELIKKDNNSGLYKKINNHTEYINYSGQDLNEMGYKVNNNEYINCEKINRPNENYLNNKIDNHYQTEDINNE